MWSWRVAVALVCAVSLLGPAAKSAGQGLSPFADVAGHWAEASVRRGVGLNLVSGYPDGTFRPDEAISRAAFVKIMVQGARLLPGSATAIPFADVTDHWVATQGYLAAAVQAGLVQRDDYGDQFEPDRPMTREEMAVIAVRTAGRGGATAGVGGAAGPGGAAEPGAGLGAVAAPPDGTAVPADAGQVSHSRRLQVEQALALRMMTGFPDQTFRPLDPSTRAQAVVIVLRVVDRLAAVAAAQPTAGRGPEPTSPQVSIPASRGLFPYLESLSLAGQGRAESCLHNLLKADYDGVVSGQVWPAPEVQAGIRQCFVAATVAPGGAKGATGSDTGSGTEDPAAGATGGGTGETTTAAGVGSPAAGTGKGGRDSGALYPRLWDLAPDLRPKVETCLNDLLKGQYVAIMGGAVPSSAPQRAGIDLCFQSPDSQDAAGSGVARRPIKAIQTDQHPWPMFRGGAQHIGRSAYDTRQVNGTELWRFATGSGIESSPAVGRDGTIYVGSHDNTLYAVNPDGTLKWKYAVGSGPVYKQSGTPQYSGYKGIISSPALAADGTVYFSSMSDRFIALNPNGTLKWQVGLNLSIDIWSSPTAGPDGTVYIGSHDNFRGTLYAYNPDGSRKWAFPTESDIASSAAIAPDGTLYVGSGDRHLYAIHPNGTLKWRFRTGKHVESSPAIGQDGTIYVGSADNYVYAVRPDGTEKWRFATGGPEVFSSPAIGADGTIYVGSGDKNLYALNPDGREKWRFVTGGETASPTVGADGTIYIGSLDGNLYALDPAGKEKWRFASQGGSGIVTSPAIGADGTVYLGSWDKNLYAIGGPP